MPESARIPWGTRVDWVRSLYPGVALCIVLALGACFLADHYGLPSLLAALLLGWGFASQTGELRLRPGVDFCAQNLLRVGVALLGARIGFGDLQSLGGFPIVVVMIEVPVILGVAVLAGRWLGLSVFHSLVSGAAVAICGVSAAVAVAAALPLRHAEQRHLLGIVVGVPVLGSLAMALYPALTQLLGYSDAFSGLFLGATIHDVAQAAAAGYLVSDDAGDVATVTKLFRVALLVPLVLVVGLVFRDRKRGRPPVPLFLVGFVALVALNGFGWLSDPLRDLLSDASRACLLVTMAALGIRTSVPELFRVGWRPLAHLVVLSLLLLLLVGGALAVAHARVNFT